MVFRKEAIMFFKTIATRENRKKKLAVCRFRRWSPFKLPLVFFDRMC